MKRLLALPLVLLTLGACASKSSQSDWPYNPVDRTNLVTMRGKPLTLQGNAVKVGDRAPGFIAVANDMTEKNFNDYRGKTILLSTVPSIDTPVCDRETRTFNEKAAALPGDVVVLTISMDLPFAQKRWCGAYGIERVVTLSDHKNGDVGANYGLYIKENGLLARSVMVIDSSGVIRYQEIVPEVTTEPNYEAAIEAARAAAK